MNKLLRFPLVVFILLFSIFTSAQDSSAYLANCHTSNIDVINNVLNHELENDQLEKKDFSYVAKDLYRLMSADSMEHDHDHDTHQYKISLIDVITSDEGADFNCSGGFCMNRSHFHKKGLTLNRQFFDYFVSIDC